MPLRMITVTPSSGAAGPAGSAGAGPTVGAGALAQAFAQIRTELKIPAGFPPEVDAAAQEAAAHPQLPTADLTDLPFFTIDPPGSTDLDQAMHLERSGKGYRVRYAIADLPAFVTPGGPVDAEARRRGQTLYAPDQRSPLHPLVLSEGAASLLPGQVRPAYVWDITLDADGEDVDVDLTLALVKSVDRLDYGQVQAGIDGNTGDARFELLKEIGERRVALEEARGGASLPIPQQEVVLDPAGYRLQFRPALAAEDWNAQISLLTGMAAADIMLGGQIGLLRTMPGPDRNALARFHRQAAALGARWPAEQPYGVFLRSLDRSDPRQLAIVHEAAALFRGAGYTPFDGDMPDQSEHAAVAAPYAHVTAPLRRLVDRFGLVVCESLCRGADVPSWAREALPSVPAVMAESDRLAGQLERACTDAVEAAVLAPSVGSLFDGVVVDVHHDGGGSIQIAEPAVLAPVSGPVELGAAIKVKLVEADLASRTVRFSPS
jgi:exoribonuclease R